MADVFSKIKRFLFPDPRGHPIGDDVFLASGGSRDEWRITKGDHAFIVNAEMMSDGSRVIYLSSINGWLPPHSDDLLTDSERDRLITIFRDRLAKSGIRTEVQ